MPSRAMSTGCVMFRAVGTWLSRSSARQSGLLALATITNKIEDLGRE